MKEIRCALRTIASIANLNYSYISKTANLKNIHPLSLKSKENIYDFEAAKDIITEFYKNRTVSTKKVQCFYNFKGGTGKTSLCFQVSYLLAICGYRVLVVDSDPQAHLSTLFGFDSMDKFYTLYDAIVGNLSVRDVIREVHSNLHIIPSNLSFTKIMMPLDQMAKREEVVKNTLSEVEDDYDFIIFDTNPTISTLNRNIVYYSDVINIVCETQPLSINGLKILFEDLEHFFKIMRSEMPSIFIIPNKYEDRASSSAESMSALRMFYKEHLMPDFAVRRSEDLNSASKQGLPLFSFARRNSNALEDIIQLTHEIIESSTKKIDSEKGRKVANG
ncbi:MAG: ParA family protein [Alphaproteobacteria bacterium]|jgi:chromosome partitioning protein